MITAKLLYPLKGVPVLQLQLALGTNAAFCHTIHDIAAKPPPPPPFTRKLIG